VHDASQKLCSDVLSNCFWKECSQTLRQFGFSVIPGQEAIHVCMVLAKFVCCGACYSLPSIQSVFGGEVFMETAEPHDRELQT